MRTHFVQSLMSLFMLAFVIACGAPQEDSRVLGEYYGGASVYYAPNEAYGDTLDSKEVPNASPAVVEQDDQIQYNPYENSSTDNLITFAADVDTASYTISRRMIEDGVKVDPSYVRVEELINYFDYSDRAPAQLGEVPFLVHLEASPTPYAANKKLLRVGIKGYEVPADQRKPANLVYLLDVSGSMSEANKLPLVIESMVLLLDQLNENDTISIVTYAGFDSVALPPTPASEKQRIINVLEGLSSGGSTNGSGGIIKAYELAQSAFKEGGINRIILCTDGDFNVGLVGEELNTLIEEKRETGVSLSVFGFGLFYDDGTMERLADLGNGNYAFIDQFQEAKRALVDRLVSTVQTIAKDVKIQVEVNPTIIKSYRLIGYENRKIADEDFRNDRVDAGEIGAGHTVTALIELDLYPMDQRPSIDSFRLSDQPNDPSIPVRNASESTQADAMIIDSRFAMADAPLAFVRFRHKQPDASAEDPAIESITTILENQIKEGFSDSSRAFKLSSTVAAFAEVLRESPYVQNADLSAMSDLVESLAQDETDFQDLARLISKASEIYSNSSLDVVGQPQVP